MLHVFFLFNSLSRVAFELAGCGLTVLLIIPIHSDDDPEMNKSRQRMNDAGAIHELFERYQDAHPRQRGSQQIMLPVIGAFGTFCASRFRPGPESREAFSSTFGSPLLPFFSFSTRHAKRLGPSNPQWTQLSLHSPHMHISSSN
jgi:hypothetical protein